MSLQRRLEAGSSLGLVVQGNLDAFLLNDSNRRTGSRHTDGAARIVFL